MSLNNIQYQAQPLTEMKMDFTGFHSVFLSLINKIDINFEHHKEYNSSSFQGY